MRLFSLFLLLLSSSLIFAQVDGRVPVSPNSLREADVAFSKRVWRVIDLREKQNRRATWPGAPITKILYEAGVSGKLVSYRNDSLRSKFSLREFNSLGNDTAYQETPIDPNDPSITRTDTIISLFDPVERIEQLMIMEDWYFDRKLSTMIPRIIAIAPLYHVKAMNIDLGLQPLCWFKYYDPKKAETDCRGILVTVRMFNKENSSSAFTFDDWFEQRQFGSFIVKVSNVENVSIMQYPEVRKNGLEALIEAERQKKENYEQEANEFED